MSEPLYRIENDTFTATMESDGSNIPLTQMLINVGVLMPVEPDHYAAMRTYRRMMNEGYMEGDCVGAAVDAAFGVTDE